MLQRLQPISGPTDIREITGTFRYEPGNRTLMASDDNLFSRQDSVEKFTESGLCFECRNGRHNVVSQINRLATSLIRLGTL